MPTNRITFHLLLLCVLWMGHRADAISTYVWQPIEITFKAHNEYVNPYVDVILWVDLQGPNFNKRVYGYWDGGQIFKVRVLATAPGQWRWQSVSNQPDDKGLTGRTGVFTAKNWMDKELQENPNRRGILRITPNGRALQYADGTPFFMIGDTWWAASTWRVPFRGERPDKDFTPGPTGIISFEELIAYRKRQGYNSINIIAAYANWSADHMPSHYWDANGLCIRSAWEKWGFMADQGDRWTAKDMHDEQGNRPFTMLPEREGIPDYNHLNPAYFQSLDKKINHLWEQGFIAMLEPVRRDCTPAWAAYFDFKTTYARFVHYMFSRYGAYNLILSGIHLDDIPKNASLQAEQYNKALTYMHQTYGAPPFGQPVTTLITLSTYKQFGHGQDCPWLTMHTVGNKPRDNRMSGYIDELFQLEPPYPAVNLEPYYPAWFNKPAGERPPANSERDNYFARAQMYSCVLSGALAGHVFGHAGYDCTTTGEPRGRRPYIWEALLYESGAQMQFLKAFMLSEGNRYQALLPATKEMNPSKAPNSPAEGLDGWGFMMRTAQKDLAFLYFENKAQRATLSGFQPNQPYQCDWFDPRCGQWTNRTQLVADDKGILTMPAFPGRLDIAQTDWAAKLKVSQ